MPLNAIIFDMDGVLCATDDYHYRSWKEVVADYGIPFSRQDNQELLGLTRKRSLTTLLKGRLLSKQQMEDILKRKNQVFLELVKQMSVKDLLPGVRELLDELADSSIRMAVASASRNTGPVLEQLGIETYMDVVIDGNKVRESKPAPNVFIKTASALGVPPYECLVIEDSQAGVQAARAANMCVLGLGPKNRFHGATRVLPGLQGVNLEYLKSIHKTWTRSIRQPSSNKFPFHYLDR
jgi:beta-phosphoglucomutase